MDHGRGHAKRHTGASQKSSSLVRTHRQGVHAACMSRKPCVQAYSARTALPAAVAHLTCRRLKENKESIELEKKMVITTMILAMLMLMVTTSEASQPLLNADADADVSSPMADR